jgi:hypothetical protein
MIVCCPLNCSCGCFCTRALPQRVLEEELNSAKSNVGVLHPVVRAMLLDMTNGSSSSYASHPQWRPLRPNSCRTLQRCIYQKGGKECKAMD